MKYIEEYQEGDPIKGVYLCKNKQSLKTKMGKTYYSLTLQDKTGMADCKVWELNNGIGNFEAMDYIAVNGQVTSFQGNLQWNVVRIRKASEGEYDPVDYMPSSKKDIKEMYASLMEMVDSVGSSHLKQLLFAFFDDAEIKKCFCAHSAAKSVHHGFMGGLLEHTLSVARICDYMSGYYPVINRDLLITSALLHDIAKTKEISTFPENDYTDDGQLLGHIYMGAEWIRDKALKIEGFPAKTLSELRHCILAHHGELEYGSPKKPELVEAVALNLADNMDAKMQTLTEIMSAAGDNKDWLGYNRLFEANLRATTEIK